MQKAQLEGMASFVKLLIPLLVCWLITMVVALESDGSAETKAAFITAVWFGYIAPFTFWMVLFLERWYRWFFLVWLASFFLYAVSFYSVYFGVIALSPRVWSKFGFLTFVAGFGGVFVLGTGLKVALMLVELIRSRFVTLATGDD